MKQLLVVCALAGAIALLAVGGASASQATVSVTPVNPAVGDYATFTGCGWTATNPNGTRNLVVVWVHAPDGSLSEIKAPADKSGCFTTSGLFSNPLTGLPGDYLVTQTGSYWVQVAQGGAGKTHQANLFFTVS